MILLAKLPFWPTFASRKAVEAMNQKVPPPNSGRAASFQFWTWTMPADRNAVRTTASAALGMCSRGSTGELAPATFMATPR